MILKISQKSVVNGQLIGAIIVTRYNIDIIVMLPILEFIFPPFIPGCIIDPLLLGLNYIVHQPTCFCGIVQFK